MNTIVIGSSREQKLPSLVLEQSILRHAKAPVRVIHTYDRTFPSPKDKKNQSRTGFSFARFAIPELVGYEGVAAYLECDQLVFRNVGELFAIPFKGATVLRPPNQASVLLLDCDHLRWDVGTIVKGLDQGKFGYDDLMVRLCIVGQVFISKSIPNHWNALDRYEAGKTALLHYSNMALQPWRRWGHPLMEFWLNELLKAIQRGRIPVRVVEEDVGKGHIVPQVLAWVRKRLPKPL